MAQLNRVVACLAILLLATDTSFAQVVVHGPAERNDTELATPTFLEHLQQYYEQARKSRATTAVRQHTGWQSSTTTLARCFCP